MTSVSPASSSTPEVYGGRQAPWDGEAEQAVLGAMLLDQDAALRAAELVDDTMFYREGYRRIFRAMLHLTEQRIALDPLTLRDELARRGELESAGGVDALAQLADAVPTAANLEFHARIIREKSILRKLIEASTTIIQDAYEARTPASELLDRAESRIFQVAQSRREEGFARMKEMLWPAMERIETLQKNAKSVTGVPTGFHRLDEMTAGFQPSELIIVAARPSMGKTAFCLNIAAHAAIEGQVGVAIFSLEMSKEALVQRLLCAESGVNSQRVRTGQLKDEDFTKLARGAGVLGNANIWIDDTPSITLLEMRSKARRLKADNDVGMIIVDYLQLMRSPEFAENRVQEISDISRSLKALARELELPVVALSQLSRASEQRGGERTPILSDLRDSGAIEQDADIVLFIHRPEMYADLRTKAEKEGKSLEGIAEVQLAKHRNGPTGLVELQFRKNITRFVEVSDRQPPPDAVSDDDDA
ncbi:MAG TPA: replicative DNA helicase [Gemmatimonadales bacterium]